MAREKPTGTRPLFGLFGQKCPRQNGCASKERDCLAKTARACYHKQEITDEAIRAKRGASFDGYENAHCKAGMRGAQGCVRRGRAGSPGRFGHAGDPAGAGPGRLCVSLLQAGEDAAQGPAADRRRTVGAHQRAGDGQRAVRGRLSELLPQPGEFRTRDAGGGAGAARPLGRVGCGRGQDGLPGLQLHQHRQAFPHRAPVHDDDRPFAAAHL